MHHIALAAGKEVINTQNVFATFNQAVAQVRAKKAGSAGD
jgi:hypothetical protein